MTEVASQGYNVFLTDDEDHLRFTSRWCILVWIIRWYCERHRWRPYVWSWLFATSRFLFLQGRPGHTAFDINAAEPSHTLVPPQSNDTTIGLVRPTDTVVNDQYCITDEDDPTGAMPGNMQRMSTLSRRARGRLRTTQGRVQGRGQGNYNNRPVTRWRVNINERYSSDWDVIEDRNDPGLPEWFSVSKLPGLKHCPSHRTQAQMSTFIYFSHIIYWICL